jgi:hypothetical protein
MSLTEQMTGYITKYGWLVTDVQFRSGVLGHEHAWAKSAALPRRGLVATMWVTNDGGPQVFTVEVDCIGATRELSSSQHC